jgi:hypothetical protein
MSVVRRHDLAKLVAIGRGATHDARRARPPSDDSLILDDSPMGPIAKTVPFATSSGFVRSGLGFGHHAVLLQLLVQGAPRYSEEGGGPCA